MYVMPDSFRVLNRNASFSVSRADVDSSINTSFGFVSRTLQPRLVFILNSTERSNYPLSIGLNKNKIGKQKIRKGLS